MKVNKWIFKRSTYRKKHEDICKEIKNEPPDQKILKANVRYITKVIYEREVKQLIDMLTIKPNSKSSLIRHLKLYNALPNDIKLSNPMKIRRTLKKLTVSFKD